MVLSGMLGSAANAQQAAEPGPVELPQVTVETSKDKAKTAKKSTKKIAPQKAVVTQAPTPAAVPTGDANANADTGEATPYSPVKNYVPNNTATGTKTDTPLRQVPQSISVVGAEQIRDQGARSTQEALRYTAGVTADAYGLDSRADGSFIRGTNAIQYLDGMRMTFGGYNNNYRLDPFFMERIEVLRGPASVLYGQASVGGIINSVSKRPNGAQGGEISVEYGTFDFKQVKFDNSGHITSDGKWSYRLIGLARDAETQVDYVDNDRYAIAPSISYRPDTSTTITVLGHVQRNQTGSTQQFWPHVGTLLPNVSGNYIPQNRFVGEPSDKYDTDAASATLLVEHKFNDVFKLQHSSRYTDVTNDYHTTYTGFFAGVPAYIDPAQTMMYRITGQQHNDAQTFTQDTNLEAKFATGPLQHRVLGGVDYSNYDQSGRMGETLNTTPFNVYNPTYGAPASLLGYPCGSRTLTPVTQIPVCDLPDQNLTQTGLYVQDQMRLGNWIGVVGMRKDWAENDTEGRALKKDEAITYRAGLMYEFAFGLTPYISYAESFDPIIGTTAPQRGATPFKPREGTMYEAGFKYQPVGSSFMVNASVYDIVEANRPGIDPDYPLYSAQIAEASIKGFEIETAGKVTENLKVIAAYSLTESEYAGPAALTANAGKQIESMPKHLASLWALWEFDQPYLRGWSVGAGVRYIGASWGYTRTGVTIETPDVTLFDAMVAYEENNWRWSINAQNLEDKEYLSTCLGRGDCFLGSARTITTGLTYKY